MAFSLGEEVGGEGRVFPVLVTFCAPRTSNGNRGRSIGARFMGGRRRDGGRGNIRSIQQKVTPWEKGFGRGGIG